MELHLAKNSDASEMLKTFCSRDRTAHNIGYWEIVVKLFTLVFRKHKLKSSTSSMESGIPEHPAVSRKEYFSEKALLFSDVL